MIIKGYWALWAYAYVLLGSLTSTVTKLRSSAPVISFSASAAAACGTCLESMVRSRVEGFRV